MEWKSDQSAFGGPFWPPDPTHAQLTAEHMLDKLIDKGRWRIVVPAPALQLLGWVTLASYLSFQNQNLLPGKCSSSNTSLN